MALHRPALTPPQAAFLQALLPPAYSLQLAPLPTPKRDCPRKLDHSFLTDFPDPPSPRPSKPKPPHPVSADKPARESSGRKEGRVGKEAREVAQEERRETGVKEEKFRARTATEVVSEVAVPPSKKGEEKEREKERQKEREKEREREREVPPAQGADLGKILQRLRQHKSSWPFRLPVDPIKQEVPNYLEVVKEPMDLRTMQRKLKSGGYPREELFDQDVRRIISNSYLFNPKTSVYHAHTVDFENYYAHLLATLAPEGKRREREKLLRQIQGLGQAQLARLVKRLYKEELAADWEEVEIDLAKLTEAQMRELTSLLPPDLPAAP